MTETEKRNAAKRFFDKWNGRGREDEDDRSFWIDLLQDVFGQKDVTSRIKFQKKVIGADGNTKRIDAYIPETRVLIEQKSLGIALDKPQAGHGGKTPYEQAKEYDNNLPLSEKAKWIILSNFEEFWIYDMDTKVPTPQIVKLEELPEKISLFNFLIKEEVQRITEEVELSVKAGELVGKIHDRFLEQYHDPMAKRTQNSLNILCVRLVFCLYAEDAHLFGDTGDEFTDYISQYEPKDIRQALLNIFKVLDTPEDEREDLYLDDELAAFPYVNGGLFENENIVIPKITQEIKETLIESAAFDWSDISPTIFGAVFESTLNPETRRSGGMHYTSIENIHKVIDPLFLDELKEELFEIKKTAVVKKREAKLRAFQDKLAGLRWLDPAAGSGNFLTETYLCIRRLENEVLDELFQGQIVFGTEEVSPIRVSIDQFYGIEINDFAVAVAKAALWIAESQMMQETADIVHQNLDFFPLKTNATIIEGNALRMDWNRVVPARSLNYICGNPPFVGKKEQTKEQKQDLISCFENIKGAGNLDYVAGWYKKAAQYTSGTAIRTAFVSTNSITQGEQVPILWPVLFEFGIDIDFAYRTFRWDSEAMMKAQVHCVIIGLSYRTVERKVIYDGDQIISAHNINPYLIDAENIIIKGKTKPICDVPEMSYGSMPIDNNHLILTPDELEEYKQDSHYDPDIVKQYVGGKELINNKQRYCIWLKDVDLNKYIYSKFITDRVEATRQFRLSSSRPQTLKAADTPQLFGEIRQPDSDMLVVPKVSSENRRYIPVAFVEPETIVNGSALIIPGANLYLFGIMTSNVHNAWMRTVAGRMKSDYQYSASNVYNTFPFPTITEESQRLIEGTAKGILDARKKYQDYSMAEMYGERMYLFPELISAHRANDRAVWEAYGRAWDITSESDCVAFLMQKYKELTEE